MPTHSSREYYNSQYIHAIAGAWLRFVNHFWWRSDIQSKILDVGSIFILNPIDYDSTSAAFRHCLVPFDNRDAFGSVLKGEKQSLLYLEGYMEQIPNNVE